MDEETIIINSNTRNEKIKNFIFKNKKLLVLIISFIIFCFLGYFIFAEYDKRKKIEVSNQYNSIISEYSKNNKEITKNSLIDLINKKDSTYSPLSLYFIIDNELLSNKTKVNDLFDIIIEVVSMDQEIKNLIIYKKALFNADFADENNLLDILNPIINSKSVWKSHSLYLIGEYFFSKGEKQKSKEFLEQLISLEDISIKIKTEAQKRLRSDFSE